MIQIAGVSSRSRRNLEEGGVDTTLIDCQATEKTGVRVMLATYDAGRGL